MAGEVEAREQRHSSTGGLAPGGALGGGRVRFEKYEGLGNDFVVIEADRGDAVPASLARELCDRRLGVGADGVLLVLPPEDPKRDGRMIVINADGSIPEMCGNGLRCVALHVARRRLVTTGVLSFETGAGVKRCTIDDTEGRGSVSVEMGLVRWIEDITLDLDGERWELALADAGNPHAITRRQASRSEIDVVGPRIATHPRFAAGGRPSPTAGPSSPAGVNVEFAVMRSPTEIDVVVWERGVGVTQACGTGACATAVVAVTKGWSPADTDITVRLLGGVLRVLVQNGGEQVVMTGPARHVFSGALPAAHAGGHAR